MFYYERDFIEEMEKRGKHTSFGTVETLLRVTNQFRDFFCDPMDSHKPSLVIGQSQRYIDFREHLKKHTRNVYICALIKLDEMKQTQCNVINQMKVYSTILYPEYVMIIVVKAGKILLPGGHFKTRPYNPFTTIQL